MGLRQERDRSPAYGELIQEFFDACHDKYGRQVLMQFEDFGNTNAFGLLEKHRHTACVFNDDIQGTASVVLGGVLASLSLCDKKQVNTSTHAGFTTNSHHHNLNYFNPLKSKRHASLRTTVNLHLPTNS